MVRAAGAQQVLLLSLVRLQLLLCLNLELKRLLDFVGGGRGPVRLGEESSGSWCYESGVLQDRRAHVEHLRIGEVQPVDVEDGAGLDVLLAVANHLNIAVLCATDGFLAELVVLLRLVRLETQRAARLTRRLHR